MNQAVAVGITKPHRMTAQLQCTADSTGHILECRVRCACMKSQQHDYTAMLTCRVTDNGEIEDKIGEITHINNLR